MTTIEKKKIILELRDYLERALCAEGEVIKMESQEIPREQVIALLDEFNKAMQTPDNGEISIKKELFPTMLIAGRRQFAELYANM